MRSLISLTFLLPCVFAAMQDSAQQLPLVPPAAPASQNARLPSLADLLTIEPSASIFYSYARELSLSQLFSEPVAAAETLGQPLNGGLTLVVPTNRAVMALSRKPHQGPSKTADDDNTVVSEEEFDRQSKENIQRWVEAHIIPIYPLDVSTHMTYDTLLKGKSVSFTASQNPQMPMTVEDGENSIKILSSKTGSNGVLYIIDGTISVD
jgi:hypothetical protein